jgi:hypothetical protein
VSVFEARRNRDLARQQLSQGLEPSEARKQKKREVRATFREIAQEWWNIKERELRMRRQTRAALNQLYDFIGDRPLDDIAAPSYCRPSSRYPRRARTSAPMPGGGGPRLRLCYCNRQMFAPVQLCRLSSRGSAAGPKMKALLRARLSLSSLTRSRASLNTVSAPGVSTVCFGRGRVRPMIWLRTLAAMAGVQICLLRSELRS